MHFVKSSQGEATETETSCSLQEDSEVFFTVSWNVVPPTRRGPSWSGAEILLFAAIRIIGH